MSKSDKILDGIAIIALLVVFIGGFILGICVRKLDRNVTLPHPSGVGTNNTDKQIIYR